MCAGIWQWSGGELLGYLIYCLLVYGVLELKVYYTYDLSISLLPTHSLWGGAQCVVCL